MRQRRRRPEELWIPMFTKSWCTVGKSLSPLRYPEGSRITGKKRDYSLEKNRRRVLGGEIVGGTMIETEEGPGGESIEGKRIDN